MRIFADNFSDQFLHDIALGIQSLLTYFHQSQSVSVLLQIQFQI
jgi:hypothetical protein